jgi:sodium transport system permease protein
VRTPLLAVFLKEWVDHLRDRRSLGSALAFPVVGPIVFAVMMSLLASWADRSTPAKLAVVGAERAPTLIAFLERVGMGHQPAPGDYEAAVQDGTLDAVLIIPEAFAEQFGRGRPAAVQLVHDQSRRSAGARVDRLRKALAAYSGHIGNLRLLARGVDPALATPLTVDEVDLATPEKLGAMLLNMIPLFLVMAAFIGGMNVAIDATAGERERGSFEALLVNPVPRHALVLGKWLTTALVACLAVTLTLAGFVLAIERVPLADLGVKVAGGGVAAALLFAAVLPLVLLASAAQMLVATYARSFKEAQTWLSLLLFLPVVPGMVLTFIPLQGAPVLMAIPTLGQHLLIEQVLRGEGLPALGYALSVLGALLPAAAALWACARLLDQERIVYGR